MFHNLRPERWFITTTPYFDERLVQSFPLPLARMYRRASNAKTPLERHQAAYYLWEAGLKLLASVGIAEYAAAGHHDADIDLALQNLARPSTGHWWQLTRLFIPSLGQRGDQAFARIEQLCSADPIAIYRVPRGWMPRYERRWTGMAARSTVRISELFDRLIRYRNQELGHGASGQRNRSYYERWEKR